MGKLYDELMQDVHLEEGLNACINCGTCTAICPAAEFYNYDPREYCQYCSNNRMMKKLKNFLKRYHLVLRRMYVVQNTLPAR